MLLDFVFGVGGGGERVEFPFLVQYNISDTEIQHFREIPEGRDESSAEHITVPEPQGYREENGNLYM